MTQSSETKSLIISVLALVFSIASTCIAWKSLNLSESQNLQDRLLVLTGKFGEDNTQINVNSISESNVFLDGDIYFPSKISPESAPIEGEGMIYYMGSIVNTLQKMMLEKNPPREKYIQYQRVVIPVIIKSRYISKGNQYSDISLYNLRAQALTEPLPSGATRISFTSLNFANRLTPTVKAQEYLDEIYSAGGVTIELPSPDK